MKTPLLAAALTEVPRVNPGRNMLVFMPDNFITSLIHLEMVELETGSENL